MCQSKTDKTKKGGKPFGLPLFFMSLLAPRSSLGLPPSARLGANSGSWHPGPPHVGDLSPKSGRRRTAPIQGAALTQGALRAPPLAHRKWWWSRKRWWWSYHQSTNLIRWANLIFSFLFYYHIAISNLYANTHMYVKENGVIIDTYISNTYAKE